MARAVVALLGLNAVLAWLVVIGVYTLLERVWKGMAGRLAGAGTLEAHWSQLHALRLVQGVAWLATAMVFLWWLYRAYRNLPGLGAGELAFTPRAAVSAFFVPVVNVVVPVRVMRELWHGSDPVLRDRGPGARPTMSPWVAWWWGVFVASVLLDPVVFRLTGDLSRLTIGTTVLLVVGQLLEMSAAVLAMVVVWSVNQGQQEIFARHDG